MTVNKKLFHLGNDVVSLLKKIEKSFPKTYSLNGFVGGGYVEKNDLRECLLEMLSIINIVRMECLNIPEKEDHVDHYIFKVACSAKEIDALEDLLDKHGYQDYIAVKSQV